MAQLLLLSDAGVETSLPVLGMLGHRVRQAPLSRPAPALGETPDLFLVDAREALPTAFSVCLRLAAAHPDVPVIALVAESGLPAVSARWRLADMLLPSVGPAELDARIRLAVERSSEKAAPDAERLEESGLSIDEANFSAKAGGRTLDLTFKEFELLRFFVGHPGRVFTREQLLSEVWGTDYFGGTRTVDVHVRRLRAKLGEHEQLIGTVRNVGYRLNRSEDDHAPDADAD